MRAITIDGRNGLGSAPARVALPVGAWHLGALENTACSGWPQSLAIPFIDAVIRRA